MLIDRKAIGWAVGCVAALAAASAYFVPYHQHKFGPVSGGSWPGLWFGIAGYVAMCIVMALAARKRVRSIPGRVSRWMQAHVWFGFLSYPLIIYHANGFAWGGPLTQVVMWLFTFTMASGILGLYLQNILPIRLTRSAPAETIYRQIEHVLLKIREEAQAIAQPILTQQEEETAHSPSHAHGGTAVATVRRPAAAAGAFAHLYSKLIVPFLADSYRSGSPLARLSSAEEAFNKVRPVLPEEMQTSLNRLQTLVNERRDLHRQRQLHVWLHGWLLVHVPLSYVLFVLATVHAIVAFRFTSPTP